MKDSDVGQMLAWAFKEPTPLYYRKAVAALVLKIVEDRMWDGARITVQAGSAGSHEAILDWVLGPFEITREDYDKARELVGPTADVPCAHCAKAIASLSRTQELLYKLARLIRNTEEHQSGLTAVLLLASVRELDPARYQREVKD